MIAPVPAPSAALAPRRVCGIMLAIIAVLLALHLAAMVVLLGAVPDGFVGAGVLVDHFDMKQRRTVPAWYAAGTLLFCGALAGLIAWSAPRGRGSYHPYWVGLAVLRAVLAVDRLVTAHLSTVEEVLEKLAVVILAYGLTIHRRYPYGPPRSPR